MTTQSRNDSTLRAASLAIVATVLAVLSFKIARSQTALCRNASGSGTYAYTLSLPATSPVTNSTQLFNSIPNAVYVLKFNRLRNTFWRWAPPSDCAEYFAPPFLGPTLYGPGGESGASPHCFTVNPGEGFVVVANASTQYPVAGTDSQTMISLLPTQSGVSLNGTNFISLRYSAVAADAKQLMDDIGFNQVVNVQRYLSSTDTIQTYTGRMGSGPAWPVVPGEAYLVRVNAAVNYIPSVYGAFTPLVCSASPTTYYVNGTANTIDFSFALLDGLGEVKCWSNCAGLTNGGNADQMAQDLRIAVNAACGSSASANAAGNAITISTLSGNPVQDLKVGPAECANTTTPSATCQVALTGSCTFNPTLSLSCGQDGAPCDDGNPCTTTDTCLSGTCVGTNPLNCNDGNPCTDDTCNAAAGCDHTNNTSACNDGNVCTYNDTCAGGTCGGTAITCTSDPCNARSCNGTATCTVTPAPNGTSCDDGNSCSVNDACSGGACVGTCYCAASPSGLVGWWPGEGNANDISGSGSHGTPVNGATFTTGRVGQAFSLDGTNDFVQVPGYLNTSPVGEVTVVFWQKVSSVKVQSTFSASSFVVNGSVFNAHVPYSDGKVYWDFGNINTGGRLSYTPSVSLVGTWQHFALVASQSGNAMRIFRNGVKEAEKTGMTPFVHANLDLDIGGAAGLGISFGGQIDEFSIFNRALSDAEIRGIYEAGSQGVCKQCTDPDGDGYGAAGDTCHNGTAADCAAADPSVWAVPATGFVSYTKVSPPATIRWAWSPATGGTAGASFYDVGRSGGGQPSVCVLSNGVATDVTESAIPNPDTGMTFLVRAKNACGVGGPSIPSCP